MLSFKTLVAGTDTVGVEHKHLLEVAHTVAVQTAAVAGEVEQRLGRSRRFQNWLAFLQ